MSLLVPNAPKPKVSHLYTSSNGTTHTVFVILTGNRYNDAVVSQRYPNRFSWLAGSTIRLGSGG